MGSSTEGTLISLSIIIGVFLRKVTNLPDWFKARLHRKVDALNSLFTLGLTKSHFSHSST